MNKPSSELIALADAIHAWQQNPATTYTPTNILQDHGDTVVELARLAANQSGRDRAGVDALLDRVVKFEECTTAEPTLRWMIRDYYDARLPMNPGLTADYATRFITGLATPPAQPAPVSGEPQLCAGGVEPGFDECPECGATWEDDCKFETQNSDGGVESRVAAVPLEIPAQRSGESRDPLGDGSVKVGPHREDAAGVAPGPSEAPSTHGKPDGAVREALRNLLDYAEQRECSHEATHRGGSIWTICDECGKKWADDRGGFIPYQEPKEITQARAALSPKIAAAETSPGDVYREVIDEALIVRHLGVAKGNAKAELNQILDWDVAAALDPAVSGRKA